MEVPELDSTAPFGGRFLAHEMIYNRLWHRVNDVFGSVESAYPSGCCVFPACECKKTLPDDLSCACIRYGRDDFITNSAVISRVRSASFTMTKMRYARATGYFIAPRHNHLCTTSGCTLVECNNRRVLHSCCNFTGICHAVSMYCQSDSVTIDTILHLHRKGVVLDMQALSVNPHLPIDDIIAYPDLKWIPALLSTRTDITLYHIMRAKKGLIDLNMLSFNECIPIDVFASLSKIRGSSELNMVAIALRCDVSADDVDNDSPFSWENSYVDRRTLRRFLPDGTTKETKIPSGCPVVGFLLPSGDRVYAPSWKVFTVEDNCPACHLPKCWGCSCEISGRAFVPNCVPRPFVDEVYGVDLYAPLDREMNGYDDD